jgi:hypothetical protein
MSTRKTAAVKPGTTRRPVAQAAAPGAAEAGTAMAEPSSAEKSSRKKPVAKPLVAEKSAVKKSDVKKSAATKLAAKKPAEKPAEKPIAKASAAEKPSRRAKPAASPAPSAPAKKPAAAGSKLVRDSFTMPQADFQLVAVLKARALDFKRPTKKSELLRAGLQALNRLDHTALQAALDALTPLKTGRPKKAS